MGQDHKDEYNREMLQYRKRERDEHTASDEMQYGLLSEKYIKRDA